MFLVPNKINAIGVTSKDEKSISLRWKPPFPPTGILRQYKITYTDHELETNITQCKLWRDYHCSTISKDLNEDTEYTIEVGKYV